MTAPPALRPPPEFTHLRWHWIDTPAGNEPWQWTCERWLPAGCRSELDMTEYVGCRYHFPCVPINPDDPVLVERVAPTVARILFGYVDVGDNIALAPGIVRAVLAAAREAMGE